MKGCITKRKDGRYMGIVELPKSADGKRQKKYIYGYCYDEVERQVNEVVYELNNNIYARSGKVSLESYLKEWFKIYCASLAPTTKQLYEFYINHHICPKIGSLMLCDILPIHLQAFYNEKVIQGNKSGTILKYHSLLNKALSDAVKNKLVKSNPCVGVKAPKKNKYDAVIPTEEQITILLNKVQGTFDEVAIILAGFVGLRRSEMCGLKWDKIDYDNKTITVNNAIVRFFEYVEKGTKNESSNRVISCPDFVFEVLKNWHQKYTGEYVCPYKPDSYSKHFKKLINDNNMFGIRYHDLRHFNATIMMQYGVPDKVAAKRTGHAQVSTLQKIYQHSTQSADQQASMVIGEVYKKLTT